MDMDIDVCMCEGLWEGLGEECVSALRGRGEERKSAAVHSAPAL